MTVCSRTSRGCADSQLLKNLFYSLLCFVQLLYSADSILLTVQLGVTSDQRLLQFSESCFNINTLECHVPSAPINRSASILKHKRLIKPPSCVMMPMFLLVCRCIVSSRHLFCRMCGVRTWCHLLWQKFESHAELSGQGGLDPLSSWL